MASISVYGYDHDMLTTYHSNHDEKEPREPSRVVGLPPSTERPHSHTPFAFLDLPYELRAQIYGYVMPSTYSTSSGNVFIRATAPIWTASRRIHRECIGMLYSDCTFDIHVTYEGVDFCCQWENTQSAYSQKALIHKRKFRFPNIFATHHRPLIRKMMVRVNEVDSYEGMMRYSYSSPEVLALGVRTQVEKLCNVMRTLPKIQELCIVYRCYPDEVPDSMRLILEPFHVLQNTESVEIRSSRLFGLEFAQQLQKILTQAYYRNSILSLPAEVRAEVYRHLLPYSTNSVVDGINQIAWHKGDATIMRTCKSIYEETYHLLYGLSVFEFTWMLR